ncbi:F0F1 ATP synthase subunit alpha [Buchnera aphidicola]|uniref:ATP synthase subunit alpha n=1 Tax=Buchnera aphidicola (Sarucallis kahawaluokalani) TaxID=1241878 RepID=A0A4D6YJE1_9GAMM|nr:F0F1 ATP synthase subunit alpha [Buchnera aphidicola]QCI25818.1 F0F1 ATP synthase subunit alpha [Buchnera aphidicola (Sarucallis kahawaluokalani)]
MQLHSNEISDLIKKKIEKFNILKKIYNEGIIIFVSDGIIKIYGITEVMFGEIVALPNNLFALALNLEQDITSAVILGNHCNVTEGMRVYSTGKMLSVPVGSNLLGRVVNALGSPMDGKGDIVSKILYPIEKEAPGVIERISVSEPLYTGYKSVDSMVPIGKGQRELIIGDRQTGKTTLAIDTIINQKKSGVLCIYVAIGQKQSTVRNVVDKLEKYNALQHTIIVNASASEAPVMQYIAPYSGCAMGEYFRDCGKNALIVYDDLSKHAISYRQISLLLRRPPGREAFPGDIFYLHSRLLERAARINTDSVKKRSHIKITNQTGSLTALPIIETQFGDVSSFIPTNVISITDGQIFLESKLFNIGIRPAINPGISVSRVGSAAQTKIIKELSSKIRIALAQYRELVAFAQFSTDLDEVTKKQLQYGEKITEVLKQKQHYLMSVAQQAIIFFAAEYGFLDDVSVDKISIFEKNMLNYFNNHHIDLVKKINTNDVYTKEIQEEIIKNIKIFKKNQY